MVLRVEETRHRPDAAGNTDPACELSPFRAQMLGVAETASGEAPPDFAYRNYANAAAKAAE
ncbi:MAG: hypothetical protein MI920_00375 [Kiloniellales bacterium]|nr:hypothetical protein [Kiloniellales bacterium]